MMVEWRPSRMGSKTGISVLRLVLLAGVVLFASCRHQDAPQDLYNRLWSAYIAGNLPQVIDGTARFSSHGDSSSPWYWKFRLLRAEALIGQGDMAAATTLLRDRVPDQPPLRDLEFRRLAGLADTLWRSNPGEANRLLDQVHAAAADPDLQIRIALLQGAIYLAQRQLDPAERAFTDALHMARSRGNLYREALALNNLSYCKRRRNQQDMAVELASSALEVATRANARKAQAQALGNLGTYYNYLGKYEQASACLQQAIGIFEQIHAEGDLLTDLGDLGVLYDRLNDTAKAINNFERAYHLAVKLNIRADAERNAQNLALTFANTNQWDLAAAWNRRASALAQGDPVAMRYIARTDAIVSKGRGDSSQAIRICEDVIRRSQADPVLAWQVHELLGEIYASARNFENANREFSRAMELVDTTRSELRDPNSRMTLFPRFMLLHEEFADTLVDQNNDLGALRVIESSRARVLAEKLNRLHPGGLRSLNVAALSRAAKAENASFLSFWLGRRRSFLWLINGAGMRRFDLPPAPDIEAQVTRYRATIEHSNLDPIAVADGAGQKLWNMLLAQVAPLIPKGSQVVVIPDGALHRLNLETLPVPAPVPHYWIEDVQVSVAPSLEIAISEPPRAVRRDASLLLIGAPDYTGTEFPPLAHAAGEVRDIQSLFTRNQAVYTGPQASPATYVKAGAERFSLIHFTAHAEANREAPLQSAIILSRQDDDYKLYARDVIDVPIQADLVTISACSSAGVRAYAGEGLIGFAWAFLEAGARSVIAGLWDVSDTSTEPLMQALYAGIAAGRSPASALREAKLKLLHGDPRFRKPYFWAPFEIYIRSLPIENPTRTLNARR
jgi:CHAT domain-containing protein/tetratricopeptide (TPR) repeat protein